MTFIRNAFASAHTDIKLKSTQTKFYKTAKRVSHSFIQQRRLVSVSTPIIWKWLNAKEDFTQFVFLHPLGGKNRWKTQNNN